MRHITLKELKKSPRGGFPCSERERASERESAKPLQLEMGWNVQIFPIYSSVRGSQMS